jgi:DNA-binding NtrC family response regulator
MMPVESFLKLKVTPNPAVNLSHGAEKCALRRVLVVDDEALIRWSVAETLRDDGWQVTEAADAESALDVFPDIADATGLVFLDLRLPDSDDLHVLAAMRQLSPETPVIVMTAHRTPELAETARTLGAFAVVDKPFDVRDLVPLAERACGQACAGTGSGHTSGRQP